VDYLRDFSLSFVGLSIGNHQFEFEVNDSFFEHFEYSEIHHGQLKVVVDLDKQERMMTFHFAINGKVEVLCDRCGEPFLLEMKGKEQLFVKFGAEFTEESAEIITIPASEYRFDLAPYIYEYLHLMLPAKIIHPDNQDQLPGCDPGTLRKLDELSPMNTHDPRWDILKNLNTE